MIGHGLAQLRIHRSWVARAAFALAVIGGLLAMHGLPGQAELRAGHSGSAAGQLVTAPMTTGSMTHAGQLHGSAAFAAADFADVSAVPAACEADHVHCMAALRVAHYSAPGTVLSGRPAPQPASPGTERDWLSRCASRAPPDPSLIRLCISRT